MDGQTTRLALVIGLQQYPQLGHLKTPVQDVRLLRRSLEALGFDVTVVGDGDAVVSSADLRRVLARFRARLSTMTVPDGDGRACALFYFAGHGVVSGGESFLLSEHATLAQEDIRAEGVPLAEVVRDMGANLAVPSLLLIDACQSFDRSRNLAPEPLQPPTMLIGDMIVDLATSPGEVAFDGVSHSPYLLGLVEALGLPGLSVGDVLIHVNEAVRRATRQRQSPLTLSSTGRRLVLNAGTAKPMAARAADIPSAAQGVSRGGELRPRKNYTDAEVAQRAHLVHKLRANDSSQREAYYFVLIEPEFERDFLNCSSGNIDLTDYGVVLASNYGSKPTTEVLMYLNQRFGFPLPVSPGVAPAQRPAMPVAPVPSLADMPGGTMIALRQRGLLGRWKHLVFYVPNHRLKEFAKAADQATRSGWNIEQLGNFGTVIYRGDGPFLDRAIVRRIEEQYFVRFDWKDWETTNGALSSFIGPA
jgi:uncharacterized caspase-like protein